MDADEFLRERKPRGNTSRLVEKWADIKKLREEGCSFHVIKEFLQENGIETSVSNLYLFTKRQLAKESTKPAKETERKSATKETNVSSVERSPIVGKTATIENIEPEKLIAPKQSDEKISPAAPRKFMPPGKLSAMMSKEINVDELKEFNETNPDSEK